MTSIILPYKASRYGDLELRYCMRSIERHLKGVGEVFLLGKAPAWLQNVVYSRYVLATLALVVISTMSVGRTTKSTVVASA